MTLYDDLQSQLAEAMRAGDVTRRETIRQLRSALHNEQIARGQELTSEEEARVVQRLVNQHRDSISEFTRGGRTDLVDKEQAELEILETYLPAQLGRAEIVQAARRVIQSVGAEGRKDQGKVMRELSSEVRGKADMRLVNEVVQELLG